MHETQILSQLSADLNTGSWWEELMGQPAVFQGFNVDKAFDSIPRTELTTAEEIARKFKDRLRYVPATDVWFLWDGRVHRPCDDDGVALKVVQNYFHTVRDSIKFVEDIIYTNAKIIATGSEADAKTKAENYVKLHSAELKKFKSFRDKISTNATQGAIVQQMKRNMDVPTDYFEKDNDLFVVRNGVIDLKAFRASGVPLLMPHDPARSVFRYFDADYDEYAKYDVWNQFLATSIIDADTASLLQKGVGAAFAATYKPRAMFNLLGAPASGKSLFLAVFDALGQDYSVMPNNQAIQVSGNDTNFYQEALRGKRFVGFSEVQGKKALDDGFIKGVMGGDKQNTRTLHAKESPWIPQCVMFVASNMALKVDFRDDATFNKVLPIRFPWSFTDTDPEHKLDRDLEDKVLEERNGVLLWVLLGMKKFWAEGLHATESVLRAMDDNKKSNSYSLQFINDLLETGLLVQDLFGIKSNFIKMGDAYAAFKFWAEEQGVKNITGKQTFNEDIKKAYYGDIPSGGRRFNGLAMSPLMKQWCEQGNIGLANGMRALDDRDRLYISDGQDAI